MKKTRINRTTIYGTIMSAVALFGVSATAQTPSATECGSTIEGVTVSEVKVGRAGDYLDIAMHIGLGELEVDGNRAVVLTPRLSNGNESVDLPSVGIYGRRRYYYYVRNNGGSMLTGADETSYRASDRPAGVDYHRMVPYQEWMDGASLTLHRSDYGCCNTLLANGCGELATYTETKVRAFFPELIYVRPQAEAVKSRSLEGSAYIDFPVNETEIYPDYRRNTVELGKIRATIDSVRNDRDVTITQVWLKGYASPESPYDNNRRLAMGRTAALKDYIQRLYSFGAGLIATDHEPEDWAGLRRYVEQSGLDHKAEILALIDSDREPDNKEWKIKKTYPEDYRYLLDNCYPALRHTDYRIAYTIRGYSDVEEIERIMRTQPQKLSLNELYLVAQKYEPGTDEFTEVFETAVRMYPGDETANLNAANAAMRRGDNVSAARYLAKAGDTPEAVYARGALAIRTGDIETARRLLGEAKARGLEQAGVTLDELPTDK